MDLAEFRDLGLLQEVNRQFFHPMGLALEMTIEEDGSASISGVWDYRDDPEGMIMGDEIVNDKQWKEHADRIMELFESKRKVREESLGWHIQPV